MFSWLVRRKYTIIVKTNPYFSDGRVLFMCTEYDGVEVASIEDLYLSLGFEVEVVSYLEWFNFNKG